MTQGRLAGVVARRATAAMRTWSNLGAACASGLHELVVYETENRGRATGGVAARLVEGIRIVRFEEDHLNRQLLHKLASCRT